MTRYSFTVDDKGRIVADGALAEAERYPGRPYYDYYPRLCYEMHDAVGYALDRGTVVTLAGYKLFCLCRELCTANIEIVPQFADDGRCSGARVDIDVISGCSILGEMEDAKTLVDIGKMSVTLAHGVRNPLNAIKGAVVYLKDKYGADATFGEFAGIIDDEIDKLDGFITQFLSTSYLDSHREEINLNDLLDKVATLVALQLQASQVQFRREYGALPLVRLDSFNIGHAILNLVNNALGAMEAGGTLTLRSMVAGEKGDKLIVVEVADTGPGIGPSDSRDLGGFPPAGCRKTGKGYGLFITGEIVRHHGGKLEITGNRDGGTSVRIILPVAQLTAAGKGA